MSTEDADHGITHRGSTGRVKGRVFELVCLAATLVGVVSLAVLLIDVSLDAVGWLDLQFLTSAWSRTPEDAGIYVALISSVYLLALTAVFTFFVGVGAAIYLEEYAADNRLTRFIELNISNLAGVPSIVYGLLGLALFVRASGMGSSLLAGALTLTLLILPIVIVSSQEALRAVPDSMRRASYGMGGTDWQTIRHVVLPEAIPGIMTGTILALARAIGETAPLIMVGAAAALYNPPSGPLSAFSAMPYEIFAWAEQPQQEFQYVAAAGIIVLLAIMLAMNAAAILIRNRYQKRET